MTGPPLEMQIGYLGGRGGMMKRCIIHWHLQQAAADRLLPPTHIMFSTACDGEPRPVTTGLYTLV
ncbi:hypothetical protein J6590_090594 [Homalodisca vitripennis]|nr:hypothetical protein J6590_090594 [Homalodisca vitripennis]